MALDLSKFTINSSGDIRQVSAFVPGTNARYTTLELHAALQDLADNATPSGDDLVSILGNNPSELAGKRNASRPMALTLTNLVVGSRIHIETQGDGTALHDSVADATSETISLSAYASGSAYNALRIKVRKGTGFPTYKPFETLATAVVGAKSIYVGQIADE